MKKTLDNSNVAHSLISDSMRNYIWNEYKIWHVNLERSINQLAVVEEMSWIEAFVRVFEEFQEKINWGFEFPRIVRDSLFNEPYATITNHVEYLEYYRCANGEEVRIGDMVQLGDLMKSDVKKTIYYDYDIECPEWDMFVPSNKSFNFVKFRSIDRILENVVAAYSLMTTSVTGLYELNGKTFVRTSYFEIAIEEAIVNSEVFLGDDLQVNENQAWQQENMLDFEERVENYSFGLITSEELWSGIIGLNIRALLFDRKEEVVRYEKYGAYGNSLVRREQLLEEERRFNVNNLRK